MKAEAVTSRLLKLKYRCVQWFGNIFGKNTKKMIFIFSCMPLLVVHFKVTWTKLKGKFIYFFYFFFWSNPVTQFDFGLLVCCTFNWIYFQICEVFVKKIFCFWELSSFWKIWENILKMTQLTFNGVKGKRKYSFQYIGPCYAKLFFLFTSFLFTAFYHEWLLLFMYNFLFY